MSVKLTDLDRQSAIREYLAGSTLKQLGAKYRVDHTAIGKMLKRRGIWRKPPPRKSLGPRLSDRQQARIVAGYQAGLSTRQLARKLSISTSPVFDTLRRHGIQLRPSFTHRTYSLDEQAFDALTPESAYWLGFLMADGCVSECGSDHPRMLLVTLNGQDAGHLNKLLRHMGSNAPVRARRARKGFPRGTASIAVGSKQLCSSLGRWGICPRKSHTAMAPPELAASRDFWRGVMDGDGWVSIGEGNAARAGICGARPLVEQFAAFMRDALPRWNRTVRPTGSIWCVHLDYRVAEAAVDLLYRDCCVALERKLLVAQEIMGRDLNRPRGTPANNRIQCPSTAAAIPLLA